MIFELAYRDRVILKADMHQQILINNNQSQDHPILTTVDIISIMTTTIPNLNRNNNGNSNSLLVHRDQQIIQTNRMKEEEKTER